MAASARISANPTSPKGRGWFYTGKKGNVSPSKSPVHMTEDEKVYSTSPAKQMRQVGKSKSEKEKMKIYASAQELVPRNTKWHVSLPNIHDTREVTSRNISKSPTRSPKSSPPLPPPPSNPPPILHTAAPGTHSSSPKGRELVKSASAGAINVITPAKSQGGLLSPQGSPVKLVADTDKNRAEENGKQRRAPPPKLPPPSPAKARAATVISAAIQEHVQSSTRSAPGDLQKTAETEQSYKASAESPGRLRSESAENVLMDIKQVQKPQPPKKPGTTPQTSNDEESPLTASTEGGVKLLARYFSSRSKEGLNTQLPSPKQSPKMPRHRQIFKKGLNKVNNIPETCEEEFEGERQKKYNLPPIRSVSNNPDDKYEVLHDSDSLASPGSPTHISLLSWYNPSPDPKVDPVNKRYQNVFDDKAFAVFDKTGSPRRASEPSESPNYKNVLVETATLVGETPGSPSSREGSHKEKKPVPLPRTQSKEKGVEIPRVKERHLTTSDSDISISFPSPQSSLTNRNSEYIQMAIPSGKVAKAESHDAREGPASPGMVVFGSLDPEWRDNFEELIEREIEMTEGLSESDTNEKTDESQVDNGERGRLAERKLPVVPPPPFVPVKKALKLTQSHNPNGPNIHRRNTPKEKRELRKGVCSASDHFDQDEYVPMQRTTCTNNTPFPTQGDSNAAAAITSSLTVPQPPPGMNPRSSTYYLKILPPPMFRPPEESPKAEPLTPARHFYIELDVPGDPTEDEPTQGEYDGQSNAESKPSPVHTLSSAPVVEANRKRKLKYPKISVGTSASNSPGVVAETRKIPYSMVKVEGQSEGDTDDNNLHPAVRRQRSQGSIFSKEMLSYVHRPLPPTPAQDAVYYKTVNYPLGHVPTTRKVWHHEYIEIDESKFNQQKGKGALPKAAEGWINIHAAGGPVRVGDRKKRSLTNLPPPPPVPRRPSCPYVEIDGDEIEELAASLPSVSRFGVGAGPKFARKLGPPPAVPGRPEETIRQRSLSNSGEYSYPAIPGLMFEWLNRKRGEGSKAYFTPRVPLLSSSKPLHHSGKKSLMETITEKVFASNPPPTVPPKTESLLREQMRLLANQPSRTRPSPYLVPVTSVRKASSYDHLPSEVPISPPPTRPKSPKEVVSNLRKELLAGETNEEDYKPDKSSALPLHLMERKKTMLPPSPPLPYQISVEAKEKALSSNPPKVPMKKKKVSSDTNREKTDARHVESGAEKYESLNSTDSVALRQARLQDRIDRNSLAMIMQNKSAIEEKLEKEHGSPKARRKQLAAAREPASKEDESLVRSLGDILLDVDALLQNRMCSEDDLIAAIETRLNIKLVKKATEESNKEDEKDDGSSQRLEDSVQVTEEDVKEVVQFMNNSHGTQPENEGEEMFERSMIVKMTQEEETSEHGALGSPKPRSSTVIIIDDAPELKEKGGRFLTERAELSPDTWDGREHMMDNEGEEEEEGTKMRDSRSLSVGLKPFRRVKVRRRTNAASDMANLSVCK